MPMGSKSCLIGFSTRRTKTFTACFSSGTANSSSRSIFHVGMERDKIRRSSDYYWWKYPNGTVQTGGGLNLRSRDMAKIGALLLQGGRWQSQQIVSEAWVKESTQPRVSTGLPPRRLAPEYGYQWWLGAFRVRDRVITSYSARGRGGQFIFVFPDLYLVAVFTGWNDNELLDQPVAPHSLHKKSKSLISEGP
jgi:CubicO group peptidase (beta-lactamase class C family)